MSILILGVKGNLGTQLLRVFEGEEVIGWDREDIDITDKDLLFKKINDLKPSVVINAGAYNAVDKCEEDEEEFVLAQKLNSLTPGYLAEICAGLGSTLVHYSTDYVFGGDEEKKYYSEDDEVCPVNKYGKTKAQGEKNIIAYSGKSLKYYIIRTSKLFGPQGKSKFSKPSFFDLMLNLAKDKKELKVVDEEFSCFTYTPDLALWTKKLLESKKGGGIYHFVNEGACTWYEASKELFRQKKTNIKLAPVSSDEFPRPAKRPKYSALLNNKFEKMRSWQDALRDYLQFG